MLDKVLDVILHNARRLQAERTRKGTEIEALAVKQKKTQRRVDRLLAAWRRK